MVVADTDVEFAGHDVVLYDMRCGFVDGDDFVCGFIVRRAGGDLEEVFGSLGWVWDAGVVGFVGGHREGIV